MSNAIAAYRIDTEPFYQPVAQEVAWFEHAYAHRLPTVLKGPTGCGKTRFIEYMAWKLQKPLITVACNEDMTASDLVGRYLLDVHGTAWHDGPLTTAVREGAICYLDEIVEARQDTTVIIHPLTDARRILPLDKKGELIHAHRDFQLVVSYNPGYQSRAKDMKPSTRQRFVAMQFDYPDAAAEARIVAAEADIAPALATQLVDIATRTRALRHRGLDEGASTRMLIHAGTLIRSGVSPRDSCDMTMTHALTDDPDMALALRGLIEATFA
ncbi:CbbQ/NirQ/NorQ/GpvN family protein [Cupriavidus plantarum]|uniref:CbbQ/NirQ/NorQ/GpvN family protein n=1 Tax=Cupriavidus plantarum TaxID=942865 RepID=UPI0015CE899D|nr:CbbQ/NirQ/NorQ/GpvN family protein [Cupriavidus plantarum]NYI02350.1 nitric oxide reductase NorQ protein [Cupriavidus plantarum]CAG2146030.1 Denitrification regulatory protein NirQ [Cupriavidus plantarum]SMR86647.1 nitric oxide reductase NorQ protein [Cupriavidus plantarum]